MVFPGFQWGPMGSNGVQRTGKTGQKTKNRKFKKPYINELWGLEKWDSGRWDGWGIILGLISPFFGDIWSHITSETLLLVVIFSILRLLFSQECVKSKTELPFEKNNSGTTTAGTASKIQYLNIIQIFKISKNIVKNDQLVFKP